jgi:gamma-glutamyltranspeptidase/glutathione hydrolase
VGLALAALAALGIVGGCQHASPASAAPSLAETAAAEGTPGRQPIPQQCANHRVQPGGVVAAPSDTAAAVGNQILQAGGSAFDAAIAVALALGVVRPQSSGLGGGGFAVYKGRGAGFGSLDFREVGPSFFTADVYAEEGRDSRRGAWSTGVPGEAAGLAELHRIGGCLSWHQVVDPALRLAADGFTIEHDLGAALERRSAEVLADVGLRNAFSTSGRVLREGEICRRPALAETLAYLQAHGGDAFYRGPLAISMAGFLAARGAPWTAQEFANYQVAHREPVSGSYRGYGIHSMGPPSSGGLVIMESLGILERRDHRASSLGDRSWTRSLVGALSHSFADRAAYGGDPDHVEIPAAALLSGELHERLSRRIPTRGPLPVLQAGRAGEEGDLGALVGDDHGTSHLTVLDGDGSAVSLTTTVNLDFGSLQADPQTGVIFNDQMDDFSAQPGKANAFGLVQGSNNRPGPGHRPLSSMSPTLVSDASGQVVLAVGGAGGPRIISGTLQALLGVLDRGMSPQDAVAAPRLHHQWLPPGVFLEESMGAEGRAMLQSEGFELGPYDYAGVLQAAAFDPASGTWSGGSDPRASGGVRVWQP